MTPTWTLPKLTLEGDAAKPPSASPLPVAEIFNEEFDASDVTVKDPVWLPLLVGENRALNLTVSPGSRTTGVLKPFSENPVPEATIEEIVTVEAPELESVSWIVSVVPF